MTARAVLAGLPGVAAAVAVLFSPIAARGEQLDTDGVLVTVEISPLDCVAGCLGGLPESGGEALVWASAATALVVVGLAMVLGRFAVKRFGPRQQRLQQ